jgi:hypothetical protein
MTELQVSPTHTARGQLLDAADVGRTSKHAWASCCPVVFTPPSKLATEVYLMPSGMEPEVLSLP